MGYSVAEMAGRARSIAVALLPLALALPASIAGLAQSPEPAVKLSRSGICHDAASPHYSRVKDFKPFDSMDACVRAGGRLSQAEVRRQEAESRQTIAVIAIAVGLAIAVAAWLLWRRLRRRPTAVEAEFREAERRRWEGHRRDPPEET